MKYNPESMPITENVNVKQLKFGDHFLVHPREAGMGEGYVKSWEVRPDCEVAQILSIGHLGGSAQIETDKGHIFTYAMENGTFIKVDMTNHMLSPARLIALSKRLEKYQTKP